MAVRGVAIWEVKPAGLAEFVILAGSAKKIHVRLGAKARAWQLTAAGVNTGRVLYVTEFADYSARASFAKKLATDAAWLKLWQEGQQFEAATLVSQTISAELPGLEGAPLTGKGGPRVRTVRGFQVDKGRAQESIALLTELKPHVERLGGRFSASQLVFAGPASGQLVITGEFADVEAWGAFQQKSAADAAFQAFIQTRILSAGSPLTLVGASLTTELAI